MTEEKTPETVDETPELVTPEEHAETFDGIEPDADISDDSVPDDVEIAARSADMDEPSTTHEKVFVLGPGIGNPSKNPYTEANGYDHQPNKDATRQYAIDQGMWPTSDVSFKSAKRHPDGASWILTYTVDVIPAADAPEGSQTPSVTGAVFPEYDDNGDATGDSTVVEAVNYSPPEDVDDHAGGDQTTD